MNQTDSGDHRPPRTRTALARRLRRESTVPERALWYLLRDRRLSHLKFRRQHPVCPFVVDFYCAAHHLVIEVDGRSHDDRGDYDSRRQHDLEARGLTVYRVANDDVLDDPESVIRGVLKVVGIDPDPVEDRPSPSPGLHSPTILGPESRSGVLSPSHRSRGEGRNEGAPHDRQG